MPGFWWLSGLIVGFIGSLIAAFGLAINLLISWFATPVSALPASALGVFLVLASLYSMSHALGSSVVFKQALAGAIVWASGYMSAIEILGASGVLGDMPDIMLYIRGGLRSEVEAHLSFIAVSLVPNAVAGLIGSIMWFKSLKELAELSQEYGFMMAGMSGLVGALLVLTGATLLLISQAGIPIYIFGVAVQAVTWALLAGAYIQALVNELF
jgi:uncharacterized membrane protein